jgi:ABC-type sugar transport system ATPase subunit
MLTEALRAFNLGSRPNQGLRCGNFALFEGETVGFVGLNESGIEECVRVLSGERPGYVGDLYVWGRKTRLDDPQQAHRAGIRHVRRDAMWIPNLSVAENMDFRLRGRRLSLVHRRRINQSAQRIIDNLELPVDPRRMAHELGFAHQRMLDLAICADLGARILLLDDITEFCSDAELGALVRLLAMLNRRGISVIVIGSRYTQLIASTQRMVVFRGGLTVKTLSAGEYSASRMSMLSVGYPALPLHDNKPPAGRETALELRGLSTPMALRGLNLRLQRGEILAVMDRDNRTRRALFSALIGDGTQPITGGELLLSGERIQIRSMHDAIRQGICAILGGNRELFLNLGIADNLLMHAFGRMGSPLVRAGTKRFIVRQFWARHASGGAAEADAPLSAMSAELQLQVALAKWQTMRPKVVLMMGQALSGDAGRRATVRAFMHNLCAQGTGFLVFCASIVEALEVCDRLLILEDGRLVRAYDYADIKNDAVTELLLATTPRTGRAMPGDFRQS